MTWQLSNLTGILLIPSFYLLSSMQGREHRHKIIGAFKAKHYQVEAPRKRGKKGDGQLEQENEWSQKEMAIRDHENGAGLKKLREQTILQLKQLLPSTITVTKMKKEQLVGLASNVSITKQINEARWETEGNAFVTRTSAFQVIARCFRDLKNNEVQRYKASCQDY